MMGVFCALLLVATVATALLAPDDSLVLPLALGGCALVIFGSFLMLALAPAGLWALATVAVWRWYTPRLHAE